MFMKESSGQTVGSLEPVYIDVEVWGLVVK